MSRPSFATPGISSPAIGLGRAPFVPSFVPTPQIGVQQGVTTVQQQNPNAVPRFGSRPPLVQPALFVSTPMTFTATPQIPANKAPPPGNASVAVPGPFANQNVPTPALGVPQAPKNGQGGDASKNGESTSLLGGMLGKMTNWGR